MDAATQNYINELAEQVVSAYDICIPILNITTVVEKIGGKIVEIEDLDDLCDGTVRKDGIASFCIAVAPHQPPLWKTFTVAHELGHLFLHMGFRTSWKLWNAQSESVYRHFGSSAQENQANEFASALLMPKEQYGQVIKEIAKEDCVDMTAVAEHFNVSLAAAISRGRRLGYL